MNNDYIHPGMVSMRTKDVQVGDYVAGHGYVTRPINKSSEEIVWVWTKNYLSSLKERL